MMNTKHRKRVKGVGLSALVLALGCVAACSTPETQYGAELRIPTPVGLTGVVAVPDEGLDRMLFLSAKTSETLSVEIVPMGKNVAAMEASADKSSLFVLSRGVIPRRSPEDERPRLSVYQGTSDREARLVQTFELDDPMERLALDREGRWVAAFGGDAKVVNPNELVLFDLSADAGLEGTTRQKSIRSFGGAPEELIFTEELAVPKGPARRFLIVRTDRDVTLVDLHFLERPEITIKLPSTSTNAAPRPLQVVYDDGDADDNTDARIAIRLEGSSDIVIIDLAESTVEGRDFSPTPNIVDVGGVPSAIDFVRTDGGLRLAALIPGLARATLVNPETTLAEVVGLPDSFSQMRRITSLVSDAPESGDVALLWGSSRNIAFWSLGSTSETPYRSVDTAQLSFTVSTVLDVPKPNAHLKVLRGNGQDIFILDLHKRQSFPLNTTFSNARVSVSTDGERLWAYQGDSQWFSSVQLQDLHPIALFADAGVDAVFDVASADGGRAALLLHLQQGWDATILDAKNPDSAGTHFYPALHLLELEP